MPLFGSKFSPKKTPLRKSSTNLTSNDLEDLVHEQRTVVLKLDDQQFLFDDGHWVQESGSDSNSYKSNQRLKKKIQELQEENNMLQLKYEIVLDMLTEITADQEMAQKERDKSDRKKR